MGAYCCLDLVECVVVFIRWVGLGLICLLLFGVICGCDICGLV